MNDLISRQAAIDALNKKKIYRPLDSDRYVISDCINAIVHLPSAERRGRWVDGNEGKWNTVILPKCSVCHTPFYGIETARYRYCPNCGARMTKEDV